MNSTIKVAILCAYPIKEGKLSIGPETTAVLLVDEIKRHPGIQLHVVTISKNLREDTVFVQDGVTFHFLASPRPKLITKLIRDVLRLVKEIKCIAPDLIHGQGGMDYGLAATLVRTPFVFTVKGISKDEFYRWKGKGHFGKFLETIAEYFVWRRCYNYISISPYVRTALPTYATIWDIPNPVDSSLFHLTRNSEPANLLMIGSLIRRKRPLNMINAVSRLVAQFPNIHMHFCGAITDKEYYKEILADAERSGLDGRVTIYGIQDREQIKDHLKAATILVLPSVQETAPVVIAEAMAAGIPVVATSVGGVSYMVDDGKTGFLVEPDDVEALADRIETLLADPGLSVKMGTAGREKAMLVYDSKNVASKTIKVYEEIITGNRT